MKSFTLIFAFSILSIFSGHSQISHDLEIYSENGQKFTLILNGRTLTAEPVTNIQILNTDKDVVHAKIIFEDSAIPEIEKKFLQLADPGTDVEKVPVSVVYKISENKKGDYKLKFASRSHKKIQDAADIIVIESNPQPVNGRIIINW